MNLYHIQDADRPMFVVASSWQAALTAWQKQISIENEDCPPEEFNPQGIAFVAEHRDLLIEQQ